jgi:hypothetical protein
MMRDVTHQSDSYPEIENAYECAYLETQGPNAIADVAKVVNQDGRKQETDQQVREVANSV